MTLIVENGLGLSNADSYVSIAEANTYVGDTFFSGSWIDQSELQKEQLLKTATRYLDSFYDFKGEKSVPSGSLRWPRTGVYDVDGIEVSSVSIPKKLKWATIEMAIFLAENDLLGESDSRGIQNIKVDVIEISFERSEKSWKMPNTVSHLLRGLGSVITRSRVGSLIDG